MLTVVNSYFTSPTYRYPEPSEPSAGSTRFLTRAAHPKDLSSLAEILTDSFHSRDGLMLWLHPLLRLGIYEDLRTRVRSTAPHYICLVAVDPTMNASPEGGSYVVGTVEMALRCINPWQLASSQSPYLSNLAVREEYRRQGVASQLLLGCAQIALEWGFQDLYLHVLENNRQARRLYFKAGYRLQQVEPSWSDWLLRQPRRLLLHKQLNQEVGGSSDAAGVLANE